MDNVEQTQLQQNGKLTTSDGLELAWRCWPAEKATGVIVLIHGLADHGLRFSETGQYFARHGWAVYACDLRGHGDSSDGHRPGRVHIDRFSDYGRDVQAMLALTRQRHPGLPHVILGHSMGGLVALSYVLEHPDEFDGLVLSSPALGAHPDLKPAVLVQWLARGLEKIRPRVLFPSGIDSSWLSRDPQVVKDYTNDPLVSDKVSARFFLEISAAMEGIQGRAPELKTPTLLMQAGHDHLIDSKAVIQWAVAAPSGFLKLVVWDELYHEIFNEPEKVQVRSCVLD